MNSFTMITRHGLSKNEITAYTLISRDYQTKTVTVDELTKALKSKKIEVTNLELTPKGIASTNGALDKYTLINTKTNYPEGTARAVILDRVESNNKLIGYTAFTHMGTLAEISVADAVALASKGLISNGKIRHTQQGDIVSSIGGDYPLREVDIDKAPKGKVTVDIMYFGTIVNSNEKYFGAIISGTSAAEMSKLSTNLSKVNAKIIADAAKIAGKGVKDSLGIKRMGANSIYGVFSLSALKSLLDGGAELKNGIGNIVISAIKYDSGEAVDEATIKLGSNWVSKSATPADDDKVTSVVKRFAKEVIDAFGSTKVN